MAEVLGHDAVVDGEAEVMRLVHESIKATTVEEEEEDERGDTDDIPEMQQTLDVVMEKPDEVQDLAIVTRDFPNGLGSFTALHNAALSRSLLSGTFEASCSTGGTARYEGTFLNDPHHEQPIPHGQGIRLNVDGSEYVGQWKDGFPDGHGEWKAPDGDCESYVGEWKAGKRHGFGIHKFANGDSYEGDWAFGKFQDRGKYTYANGDTFCGIWEKGIKKDGSFYYTDGRISRRTWHNGTLVTCQDFDGRKKSYLPTITRSEVHDPGRNTYGAKARSGIVSPRGVAM